MKHFLAAALFCLTLFACSSSEEAEDEQVVYMDFHLVRVDSMGVVPYDDQKDTICYFAVYEANTGERTSDLWYKGEDIPSVISRPVYIFSEEE